MLIKKPGDIKSSEITDKALFLSRRRFLAQAAIAGAAVAGLTSPDFLLRSDARASEKLANVQKSPLSINETLTPLKDVTGYNNFYEFGTDKYSPSRYANTLMPRPWTIAVEGEVNKPKRYDIDELMKLAPLEERIYRLRCVEGWSMVIPWIGFPLNALIKRAEPTGKAKYVEFTTLLDPKQMPQQRSRMSLFWPYVEGLRMDEANHPLTILGLGLYGETLPNQNGAPVRLIVPWKYGFKSIKSIVKIRLIEQQPTTAWMKANPTEYGFYSNVNPEVDHPRWSQATERRIGEFSKRKTISFNGYGDQVASLYQGMDLRKYF